jgi:hypothetical protein
MEPCLALGLGIGAFTGLGPLIAIPIWGGTFMSTTGPVADSVSETIVESPDEGDPRILGSTRRLAGWSNGRRR